MFNLKKIKGWIVNETKDSPQPVKDKKCSECEKFKAIIRKLREELEGGKKHSTLPSAGHTKDCSIAINGKCICGAYGTKINNN